MESKRETRRLKLRTRMNKKEGAPILAWRKDGLSEEQKYGPMVYNIILDHDVDVQSKEYIDLERAIQGKGAEIIEKHSSLFRDSIIVNIPDGAAKAIREMDGVDIMVPRAKPKALATIDGVNDVALIGNSTCSAAQAAKQAAIIDVINGAKSTVALNNGGDVNIIIWDFFPDNINDLGKEELLDRPGGDLVVIDGEKEKGDSHGGAVASTCCGKNVGLATGSNLVLLQITDDIGADLTIIESIAQNSRKAVVVNMSFAFVWSNVISGAAQAGIKEDIRDLDDILTEMKSRNPRLLFVVSGGNESLNPCDTSSPVSWNNCTSCYMWPQSRLGEAYGPQDVPFVLVGASQVFESAPQQRQTDYTNYGACMHTFTHGSVICAFNSNTGGYSGINGTSFSAPIFSSLAALRWSQRPNDSADDITSYLLSNSPDTVDLYPTAISNSTVGRFSQVTTDMKEAGADPTEYDGGLGNLVKSNTALEDDENNAVWVWIILAVVVVLLIGGWVFTSRKG